MKSLKLALCALTFFVAAPIWASTNTIWGGFEDTVNTRSNPHASDYDYNDVVFSISGNNLTLQLEHSSTGSWQNASGIVLNNNGTPFWDNASFDGTNMNVGFCIYGGGGCNGGTALDAGAQYLASSGGDSVNDVYFSVNGQVDTTIVLTITSATDTLGYELVGSNTIHQITSGVAFTPGGDFQLVGIVNGTDKYYSDNSRADVSQFAFFNAPASATPEPSSLALLGSSLLGMAGVARRRFLKK